MKYIVEYLLNKDFIKLSHIEDSFYLYKSLDKRLSLKEEIIHLNYISESPYSSDKSMSIAIADKNRLYLWFLKKTENYYLPEALSLYRKLVKNYLDIIVIFHDNIDKVIIIKDGTLVSTFSKRTIVERDLLLIKEEYKLSEVLVFTSKEYREYLESSFSFVEASDILDILNIQIDIKSLFFKVIKWLSIPLLLTSLLLALIMGFYSYFTEEKNNDLHHEYKNSQESTIKIKNKVDHYEYKNEVFRQLANEFKYVDKSLVLSKILETAQDLNITMFYFKAYEDKVHFIVKTKKRKKIPMYTKQLFESNLFEEVKNLSSRKQRDSMIEVTIRAKLKERN